MKVRGALFDAVTVATPHLGSGPRAVMRRGARHAAQRDPVFPAGGPLDLHESSSARYRYQTLAVTIDDALRGWWAEPRAPRGSEGHGLKPGLDTVESVGVYSGCYMPVLDPPSMGGQASRSVR